MSSFVWTAPDTTEHHVALAYDRVTGEFEVFVDEVSLGTAQTGVTMTSEVLFRIAGVGWAEDEQWDGVMSGVAISEGRLGPGKFVLLGGSPLLLGDVNLDNEVNGLDVDPFVAAVVGGGTAAVPEPSTLALVLAGLIGLLAVRRRFV